jgi:hypothetical protein
LTAAARRKGGREDPGWRRAVVAQLFPIGSRKTQGKLDGLTVIRVMFVAFIQAAIAVGILLLLITQDIGEPSAGKLALLLTLGTLGAGAAFLLRRAGIRASDASELERSYRKRFFLGFVVNEIPLLVGMGLGFADREVWPFLAALPLFWIGMTIVAPGRRNIEADQQKLEAAGSRLSLRDTLMGPPPKTLKKR